MTENQNAKLEAIKNRATRYELVIERGAERLRLCYTGRKNRNGIIDAIRRNGAELVDLTGAESFKLGSGNCAGPSVLLGDWRICFSGRTQREAIIAGELRWFASQE